MKTYVEVESKHEIIWKEGNIIEKAMLQDLQRVQKYKEKHKKKVMNYLNRSKNMKADKKEEEIISI